MHRGHVRTNAQLYNMTLEARTSLTFQSSSFITHHLSHPPRLPCTPGPALSDCFSAPSNLYGFVCGIPCPECPVPSQVPSAPSRHPSGVGSSGKPPLTSPTGQLALLSLDLLSQLGVSSTHHSIHYILAAFFFRCSSYTVQPALLKYASQCFLA